MIQSKQQPAILAGNCARHSRKTVLNSSCVAPRARMLALRVLLAFRLWARVNRSVKSVNHVLGLYRYGSSRQTGARVMLARPRILGTGGPRLVAYVACEPQIQRNCIDYTFSVRDHGALPRKTGFLYPLPLQSEFRLPPDFQIIRKQHRIGNVDVLKQILMYWVVIHPRAAKRREEDDVSAALIPHARGRISPICCPR